MVVHLSLESKVKVIEFAGTQARTGRLHFLRVSAMAMVTRTSTDLCPERSSVQSENGGIGDGFLEASRSARSQRMAMLSGNPIGYPLSRRLTYFASVISSPASARESRIASAPYFFVASLIVKKFPVLLLIFFPLSMR
jgi:hypothetical protein